MRRPSLQSGLDPFAPLFPRHVGVNRVVDTLAYVLLSSRLQKRFSLLFCYSSSQHFDPVVTLLQSAGSSVRSLLVNCSCYSSSRQDFYPVVLLLRSAGSSVRSNCSVSIASLLHADSAKSFVHVVFAPITRACSMPHMFLVRRLCSVKHYVRPLHNVYGVAPRVTV